MIPYFKITTFNLGHLTLQAWGAMVAIGFLAGVFWARSRVKKQGWLLKDFWDLIFWIVVASLAGARLFHIFFYEWPYYSRHLADIFRVWDGGMSSFGGFTGALLAAWFYLKKHRLNFLEWADQLVFALPLGLFIGRLGCFLIHDHPGIKTNFFLAVNYTEGARHDLGLYLSLNGLILFLLFLRLNGKSRFRGFYTIFFSLWYGFIRFFLDFLRIWDSPIADARYFYLTPAQYFSIALFLGGIYLLLQRKYQR